MRTTRSGTPVSRPDVPLDTDVDVAPPIPVAVDVPVGEWLRERVDGRLALVVGVSWFVLFQVAMLLEPQTSHTVPLLGVLLEVVTWVLLATMVAGLVSQRRWGFAGALAAGVFLTAGSIACPTTGHHPFGLWWVGQMACVLALVAISAHALRRAPKIS